MKSSLLLSIVSAAALSFVGVASAATITVGNYNLLPNTPGQAIPITVTGGEAVQGLTFYAQVADGGPETGAALGNGANIDGPAIQSVDILTGTIFATNNTGQMGGGQVVPQVYEATTTTAANTVAATGLLATLVIDTTGFNAGTYDLRLTDTALGNTNFPAVTTQITNGSITVVPEPASVALAAVVAGAGLLRRRRASANA